MAAVRLAMLSLMLLAGCAREAEPPPANESAEAEAAPAGIDAEALYAQSCASCHDGGVPKAPHRMFVAMLPPDAILAAMNDGVMRTQAQALSLEQRRALAEHLTGRTLGAASSYPPAPGCTGNAARFSGPIRVGRFGVDAANTRFIAAKVAGLGAADVPRLKLRWAFAYPDAQRARSQPSVAFGAVFVGSQDGSVYALDATTGCERWRFEASAEVRSGIAIDRREAMPRIYFADLLARVYAVDAYTGDLAWSTKVDDHPHATVTGAPVEFEGRLFVPVSSLEVATAASPDYACCTFRGSLVALNANSGEQLWKRWTIDSEPTEVGRTSAGTPILAPSGAPIWNSPTIDAERRLVYAGTGENYSSPAGGTSDALLAFDVDSGALAWVRQTTSGDAWNVACMAGQDPANCPAENGPDFDFGSAPVLLASDDGDMLVAGQKSGYVHAVDPDDGKLIWQQRVGRGGVQGGVHFGLAAGEGRIYVPISDMDDGEVYELPMRPGLYALDPAGGRELWAAPAQNVCGEREFCHPGISAAITAIPGVVFAGHMDGWLRAYAADSGERIWAFDANRELDTVSGAKARGGSFGGGGPVVADGFLYVNSGYGIYGHMPGNVLLAFAVGE